MNIIVSSYRIIKVAFGISFLLSLPAFSQGFLKTSGTNIVTGNGTSILLKGIGLGGWLVPEGYMLHTSGFADSPTEIRNKIKELIGEENANNFWDLYYQNYVNKKDIDRIAEWGFNSIRLPMHYDLLTPRNEPGVFIEKGFTTIDSLLAWCEENSLYLILDLHCAPGGQNALNISDYDNAYPSLWESELNKERTINIWKELAERYADKEWIGGYDLINETAWDLPPTNQPLRDLYINITNAIREVDTNHIIFIEGNWFATDFNGLTPPWDNNMVYSFHKYWNVNNQGAIQYLLDIRSSYNVPLWLGESGENSNQWFTDCITLMENNNVGWCWWPHKKISSIAGPLSATLTPEYDYLLRYWGGTTTAPSLDYAVNALNNQALKLNIDQCTYNRGVIDAMFRQVATNVTLQYINNVIPGLIFATNYDLGQNGYAYKDSVYHNTNGNGGATWNNGWLYRNDGVDIEKCSDFPSNGYNIGWIESGDYLNYTVNIQQSGLYNIEIRVAANQSGGKILLRLDDENIGSFIDVPNTGGWQSWQSVFLENVLMNSGIHKLTVLFFFGGFNVNYFDFALSTTDISVEETLPDKFDLQQNYPNPFNPVTTIEYQLPEDGFVKLCVYDSFGREIKTLINERKAAGRYEVRLDLSSMASGIYIYRFQANDFVSVKKMTLLK